MLVGQSAIVLSEPSFVAWLCIEVVDEFEVIGLGLIGYEVAVSEYFGPHGQVVGMGVEPTLCKGLCHTSGATEGIECRLRTERLYKVHDVGNEPEL